MHFIVGSIVAASIELLVERVASTSTELVKFLRQKQILADLDKWKETLEMIKAVLSKAEEKQERKDVKMWLDKLQNLAFDVEDILDELSTQLLRRKLLDDPQASASNVRKLISSSGRSLNPRSLKFNSRMVSKMDEITTRLEEIAKLKDQLGLSTSSSGERSDKGPKRPATTSLVTDTQEVYGRDRDRDEIVKMLLSTDARVSVIPIIGMGGIGKTTLAKLAYNDARLKGHFDYRAWVCVSEEFDVTRITKEILKYINPDRMYDGDYNLSKLQEELKDKLFQKRFLFVLDDIWSDNRDRWNSLCCPFEAGLPGSKVIITTRNQIVAKRMATLPDYELKELSFEDCFNVFTQQASGRTDFRMHQGLKEIGEEIVKRCSGLPLAAESLGGLLRDEVDSNKWKDVLNSRIWDQEIYNILPALAVSYHYLPSYLKRCFAYCSIFPKDYEFSKEEVTLLWMAEGFLYCKDSGKKEDKCYRYFDDLKSRSFFQQSSKDVSRYVMHDLISDLAQWAAGEVCLRMDSTSKISKNLRYLSYIRDRYESEEKMDPVYDAKHLRTFLPVGATMDSTYFTCGFLHKLLQLQYLRALSLRGYRIFELPNNIGELEHLRYLDVSHTMIKTLPESITTLYNLETLLLEDCPYLEKLCGNIGKLVNLCHLNNSKLVSLKEMPLGIGNLTSLLTLPNFVVGKGHGSSLGELNSLKLIKGTLRISGLQNVNDYDSEKASLYSKRNINMLTLVWNDSSDTGNEMHVLDKLRPHQELKELTISGYGGNMFPIWLGDSSFSKLEHLQLEHFRNCTFLPPVGQLPLLKYLVISRIAGVKRVGPEFYSCSKPFPSLETLRFEYMHEWEDWIAHVPNEENEGFPSLRELSIIECTELVGRLPERLPSLEKLVIRYCKKLSVSVPSLPKLCNLEIDGCKEMVRRSAIDLCSLNSVILSNISSHDFPAEWFTQGLSKVEEMKIVGCPELISPWKSRFELLHNNSLLRRLEIYCCPQLLCLVAEEQEGQQQRELPCRLQCLRLGNCESLIKLPQALRNLSLLTEIDISDCPKLISFPENGMPPQLRDVKVLRCGALKSLPEAWMSNDNTYLESLYINDCLSLAYISRVQLPPYLKRLTILFCANLRTLVEEGVSVMHEEITNSGNCRNTSLLESLEISSCPSLTSLWSNRELPDTLKYLNILNCSNLESITRRLQNYTSLEYVLIYECNNFKFLPEDLQNFSHSQRFAISKCPSLVSFPEGGLPSKTLREFCINACENLMALPNRMHNLTSLESLFINNCRGIVSLPEDGLPTSLTSVAIHNVKICKALFDCGLYRLTSLTKLDIIGACPDLVSFPPEKKTLPTSLTRLMIESFPKLESISSHIQNLTSLEHLALWKSPKLKSFPKKGLPSSLLTLDISRCPMLKQRCEKDRGKYWQMIAHIPGLHIQ